MMKNTKTLKRILGVVLMAVAFLPRFVGSGAIIKDTLLWEAVFLCVGFDLTFPGFRPWVRKTLGRQEEYQEG